MQDLSAFAHARQSDRLRLLVAVYQLAGGHPGTDIAVADLARAVNVEHPRFLRGTAQFLEDAGLAEYQPGTHITLTTDGVIAAEAAILQPARTIGPFPSLAAALGAPSVAAADCASAGDASPSAHARALADAGLASLIRLIESARARLQGERTNAAGRAVAADED